VHPFVSRVEWQIERGLRTPLRSREIARALNVSVRSLETRFRRESGATIHQAVTRLRLERALSLLATGEESVKRIAAACGYQDPSYFIRVFRLAHGMTPGAWQRQWRGRPTD
jgi:AraC-like DNA-binding protein